MGCFAHGHIDFRGADGNWERAEELGDLLTQSYDFYGSLFGVRNDTGFSPIAASRGIPGDIQAGFHAWERERDADEEEAAKAGVLGFGSRGRNDYDHPGYRSEGVGGERHGHTWILYSELLAIDLNEPGPGTPPTPAGRGGHATRGAAMGGFYQNLVDAMAPYAKKYGPENVRVVVWFDG